MRITSITTHTSSQVALVEIRTDTGESGWGQIAPYHAEITTMVLHRMVAPVVARLEDPTPDSLSGAVVAANLKFPGSFVLRALGGVETALWDLLAKREGKLVCELLGGARGSYPAYASSMRRDITPADEAERISTLRDTHGFRACKVRVGDGTGEDRDRWPGRSEELITTMRDALGPDFVINADANSAFTPARAIEIGKRLNAGGPGHFEEPCPYWEMDWTREVTQALEGDVSGGEQDNWMPVWERMVREHVVDIVQPDVCYIGGISRARRVAALAHDAGLPCTPHSANVSMVTLFTLHLMRSIPNAGPYLEYSIEAPGEFAELFEPHLEVRDGALTMPDAEPGWGVRPRAAWLERARAESSALG
ncbi:MAG: mandelate racemase/muconate lactonizing enzyme family protein [Spirochaetota bacterium]